MNQPIDIHDIAFILLFVLIGFLLMKIGDKVLK